MRPDRRHALRPAVLLILAAGCNDLVRVPTDPLPSPSPTPTPPICLSSADPYAKSVVDFYLLACSRAQNAYNEPREVLGPPDAQDLGGKDNYAGIMSLGEKGYVTVDMQTCAVDDPGPDLRVFQVAGSEPVTVYASMSPSGPFVLLEERKVCGTRVPGLFARSCDFDLAAGGMTRARYFRIEDGEHYPCPGDTVTEGADIDAIEILHLSR